MPRTNKRYKNLQKKRKMHQYNLLQPQTGMGDRITSFIHLVINDVDDCMAANLSHDDLFNLYLVISEMLVPGPGVDIETLNPHDMLTTSVPTQNFGRLLGYMNREGVTNGAPNRIRRIMAVVANMIIIPHGPLQVLSVTFHVHCDIMSA